MTESSEPGDSGDVVGQRGESHGFSRYTFHDIEPVTMTEAVVTVVTDSSIIPVRGFVQPQYLVEALESAFLELHSGETGEDEKMNALEAE